MSESLSFFYSVRLPKGYALIRLDTVSRLALHNDQLLTYTLEEDGYPDPGNGNGTLGLVTAEFLSVQALQLHRAKILRRRTDSSSGEEDDNGAFLF